MSMQDLDIEQPQTSLPNMFVKRSPGKAVFCGIVANSRVYERREWKVCKYLTLGVGNGKYIDVTVKRLLTHVKHLVLGHGFLKNNRTEYIECKSFMTNPTKT